MSSQLPVQGRLDITAISCLQSACFGPVSGILGIAAISCEGTMSSSSSSSKLRGAQGAQCVMWLAQATMTMSILQPFPRCMG